MKTRRARRNNRTPDADEKLGGVGALKTTMRLPVSPVAARALALVQTRGVRRIQPFAPSSWSIICLNDSGVAHRSASGR